MASPPWLEELREQVKQQGLPPHYVERLLHELSDHFQDLQKEEEGMDAEKVGIPETRMGEPGDLARFIGGEYRKRSFSRRHPVVMFAVMPVLLLLGIWTGLMLVLALTIETVLGEAAKSVVDGPMVQLIDYGVTWLAVALTAVTFCRAAWHGRLDWRWSLLPAAILAFFPGMTVSFAPSLMYIGFRPVQAVGAIQIMLPLAIGGWYTWKGYRLQWA